MLTPIFSFPNFKPSLNEMWIDFVNHQCRVSTKHSRICSTQFEEKDLKRGLSITWRWGIKPGGVEAGSGPRAPPISIFRIDFYEPYGVYFNIQLILIPKRISGSNTFFKCFFRPLPTTYFETIEKPCFLSKHFKWD